MPTINIGFLIRSMANKYQLMQIRIDDGDVATRLIANLQRMGDEVYVDGRRVEWDDDVTVVKECAIDLAQENFYQLLSILQKEDREVHFYPIQPSIQDDAFTVCA